MTANRRRDRTASHEAMILFVWVGVFSVEKSPKIKHSVIGHGSLLGCRETLPFSGKSRSLQLGVLLGTQDQPDRAASRVDRVFQCAPVFEQSCFTPSLMHLEQLVGSSEVEFARQRSLQIFLKELAIPAFRPAHEVQVDAVLRRFAATRHRIHEVGHRGKVYSERKAKINTSSCGCRQGHNRLRFGGKTCR